MDAAPFAVVALLAAVPLSGCVGVDALLGQGPSLPEALLRTEPYSQLVVEVDAAPGQEPCPETLEALEGTLRFLTAKPHVAVVGPEQVRAGDGSYDNRELVRLHRRTLDHGVAGAGNYGSGDRAVLHVLFLNGGARTPDGDHAAGRMIYDHAAIFVFKDSFRHAYEVRGGQRTDAGCAVERVVVLHELGHALGLVNRGVPMLSDREAPGHAGHSKDPRSVMYPSLHLGSDGRLLAPLPAGFSTSDVADLTAYRDA